jgi:hypothetical protein
LTISDSNTMPTEAVRELLKMGLAVKGTDADGSRSSHYGVFDRRARRTQARGDIQDSSDQARVARK